MPADEALLDKLLAACKENASSGTMVIVDCVPYAREDSEERLYSAAFTYLHHNFMSAKLLSASAWRDKLRKAGFTKIAIENLGIPGGRIIVASGN